MLGPEAQRAALLRWAEVRGLQLVAVHEDRGMSGAAPLDRRPGLLAALDRSASRWSSASRRRPTSPSRSSMAMAAATRRTEDPPAPLHRLRDALDGATALTVREPARRDFQCLLTQVRGELAEHHRPDGVAPVRADGDPRVFRDAGGYAIWFSGVRQQST